MLTDIIKLLPDSVANQIAAGEVIQRPASVVKELLENSLDAGATQIDLIVKDAGKSLIMISDNGCGMSETDARLSFERHATSKIRKADDLFAIRTMGFRGEALASIAAIAQVEMKTRRQSDEFGTKIIIEGSVVQEQEATPMKAGTSFAVKNLFFNVPARRNFLKSPQAEMRHIIEEFHRVTLMNPDVGFTLISNDKELFHLYPGNLKQRVVGLFGTQYDERLLHVSQDTETISVHGFIGKPEFARKTRGEQYFFVNKRFIKHPFLHHAVENAFQEMLPKDCFPTYFLNISIDPKEIDINIHPTKTEVNFQDTKLVYAIIHAAVRKSIGQHNLSPSIDFDVPADLNIDFGEASRSNRPIIQPSESFDSNFNPFRSQQNQHFPKQQNPDGWRNLYGERVDLSAGEDIEQPVNQPIHEDYFNQNRFIQIHQTYILTPVKSGLMMIDQYLAHWRILYEKYIKQLENTQTGSQQVLFPQHIQLNTSDALLLHELKPDLKILGFEIEEMNSTTFVINGTPSDTKDKDVIPIIEKALEYYKRNQEDLQLDKKLNLARSISSQLAVKSGQQLSNEEMNTLIDNLFACNVPEIAPNGKKIFIMINMNELQSRFN